MKEKNDTPWVRISVEAVVIMVSILLAFGIQAWWEYRLERERAFELLFAIRSDVEATQQSANKFIKIRQRVMNDARVLLEALATQENLKSLETPLLSLGSIFVLSSWNPVNHSYEQALGSEGFELVQNRDLRLALAKYVGLLKDVDRWNDQIDSQYRLQLEPFMVANTIYSDLAAPHVRGQLVSGSPFTTNLESLSQSRELWNLLTFKLEIEALLLSSLKDVEAAATDVLDALP